MDLHKIDKVLAALASMSEQEDTSAPSDDESKKDSSSKDSGVTRSKLTNVSKSDAVKAHHHRLYINDKGDGKTDKKEGHQHDVVSGIVKPASGHSHEVLKTTARKGRGLSATSFKGGSDAKKRPSKQKTSGLASVTPDVAGGGPATAPETTGDEATVESILRGVTHFLYEDEWEKLDREFIASDLIEDSRNVLNTYLDEADKQKGASDSKLYKGAQKLVKDLDSLAGDLQDGKVDADEFNKRMLDVGAAIEKNRKELGEGLRKTQTRSRAGIVFSGVLTAAATVATVATGGAFSPAVAVIGAVDTLYKMATSTNAKRVMSNFGESLTAFKKQAAANKDSKAGSTDTTDTETVAKKKTAQPKSDKAKSKCTAAGGKMVFGRCIKDGKTIKTERDAYTVHIEGHEWLTEEYGFVGDVAARVGWDSRQMAYDKYAILERIMFQADHVLDVGCGNGLLYEWLLKEQKKNVVYYGVDKSEQFLSEFADRYPTIAGRLRKGNVLSLNEEDLPREHFDVSVAFGVTSDLGEGDEQYQRLSRLAGFMTAHSDVSVVEFWDRFSFKTESSDPGSTAPSVWSPRKVTRIFESTGCHVQLVSPLSDRDFAIVATRRDMRRT